MSQFIPRIQTTVRDFGAGFGPIWGIAKVKGSKMGLKLPGPSAPAFCDRLLVRAYQVGRTRW